MSTRITESPDRAPDRESVRPRSQPGRYRVTVWDLGDCYALPGDVIDGRVYDGPASADAPAGGGS